MAQQIPILELEVKTARHRQLSQNHQKQTSKITSSRTSRSKISVDVKNDPPLKTQRQLLREKKKKYSDAIRQRNLNKLNGISQQKLPQLDDFQNIQTQIQDNQTINPKQTRTNINNHALANLSMIQCHNNSQLKPKRVSEFSSIRNKCKYNNNFLKKHKNVLYIQEKENQDYLKLQKYQKNSSISKKSNQKQYRSNFQFLKDVNVSKDNQQTFIQKSQEILLLPINQSSLKIQYLEKQLKQSKDHIKQLQKNIEQLLKKEIQSQDLKQNEFSINNFMVERLMNLQQEVFTLRKLKNTLELKVHSSQLKFAHEADIIRKQSAKEISYWKNRFHKLCAENLKLKHNVSDTLQISISKEQES